MHSRTAAALNGKKPSSRLLNIEDPAYDAYIAAGDHTSRNVHPTQNLDNPGVQKPHVVRQLDGKLVRYTGP